MGTIADKLLYLSDTKTTLRTAINAAGGALTVSTPFRQYAQWITEQSATLSLDFVKQSYIAKTSSLVPDRIGFSNIITFTRASGGGRFNASGVYEWLGNDVPRLDYDPVTLQPRGILIEEQRTNRLLNSAVVVTQSITTTATANTLSFYGTGSITLSGTATGTLVGTGASNRVSLTFTPTAGTLTLTVTGSCTDGQLEAGAFPTSYIPTVASQVTRSADVASVNTLSPWYNASEGTLFVQFARPTGVAATTLTAASLNDGSVNNRIETGERNSAGDDTYALTVVGGVVQGDTRVIVAGPSYKIALGMALNNFAHYANGIGATDTSYSLPTVDRLRIGNSWNGASSVNGHIQSIEYYPRRLSNDELQILTTP